MKKILIIFGTRPEAIKMAPLVKEFENHSDKFLVRVCITGQHREMLDQVLSLFSITPYYDLNIMKPAQDLFDITNKVLSGVKEVLSDFKPDLALVHGDTTTTLASSIACYYQKICLGHIEAGLRTGNKYSPWPEEINRKLTGSIADFHFAPTELAKKNLLKENTKEQNIIITGNTIIDALFYVINRINNDISLQNEAYNTILSSGYTNIEDIRKQDKKLILITGHRRENFGKGFKNICKAIKELAQNHPDFDFVYPVHLNPNVRKPVYHYLSKIKNIFLIEPLDYLPFVYLMDMSYFVITDSGGIQEEAPSLGKPVLVMRDTTERPEALEAGTVLLVGTDYRIIIRETNKLINNHKHYSHMSKAHNPYGDGKACERIVRFLSRLN